MKEASNRRPELIFGRNVEEKEKEKETECVSGLTWLESADIRSGKGGSRVSEAG